MNLYEAISLRRAVRKFKKEKLPEQLLAQIAAYAGKATPMQPEISTEVELLDNTKGNVPVRGIWKADAPYYLAFYSEEKAGYERNAGFLLEQIVLYMTAKGLGSCYLGGSRVALEKKGLKQVMLLAFGYADGVLYREAAKAKRHSLKELCVFKENVDEQMKTVLKAARLAPSSFNSQPWRFIVYQGKVHIFAVKDFLHTAAFRAMREINLGIMLAHIMLASEELWLEVELTKEELLQKKAFRSGEYVGTVIFQ